jgi:hypothetical protein
VVLALGERARAGVRPWRRWWTRSARRARWRDARGAGVAARACGAAEWRVLWPALAARVGIVMDRRGIERASQWAPVAKAGQRIPLSGDASLARTAATFVVKGTPAPSRDYIFHQ